MQQVNWALKQFFLNLHLQFNKIQRWKKNKTEQRTEKVIVRVT